MDNKTTYDKYLEAINASDFTILTTIVSNIESVNLMNLEVNANWESSVKEAVDSKINDLKTKISVITSEKTNLNNIVSRSKELKAKIEEYNNFYSKIKNISQPTLPQNPTEEQKNEYNEKIKEFNQNEQYKTELKKLVVEIEDLVSAIKAISFNAIVDTSKQTDAPKIPEQRNAHVYFNVEEILGLDSFWAYNDYWREHLENPTRNKMAMLTMNNESIVSDIESSESIIENSKSEIAKLLAQKALNGLISMQEYGNQALSRQTELLEIYKTANYNGNINDKNNLDGILREIAYLKHLAIQEKKPNVITQDVLFRTQDVRLVSLRNELIEIYLDNKYIKGDSASIDVSYDKLTELAIQKENEKIENLGDLNISNDMLHPSAFLGYTSILGEPGTFPKPSKESRETVVYKLFAHAIHVKETGEGISPFGVLLTEIKDNGGKIIGYKLEDTENIYGPETHTLYLPDDDSGEFRLELDSNNSKKE